MCTICKCKFGSLPWRSRSQHDLEAKSCPAYNFVIWSQILKQFHRNDHHIKTTCREQDLGRFLEGQGHSMTLQQNCVRSITWLFKVWFYNSFHRNDYHIETTCHEQHLGRYIEGQGHSMTLQQNRLRPITLLSASDKCWTICDGCKRRVYKVLNGTELKEFNCVWN